MTKEDLTAMVQEVLEEIKGAEPDAPEEPTTEETPVVEPEAPAVEEPEAPAVEEAPEETPPAEEPPVTVEPLNVDDIVTQVIDKLGETPRQDPNTTVADESFKSTLSKIEESLTTSGEFTEEETALLDFILVNYDGINERVDKLLGVTPSQS